MATTGRLADKSEPSVQSEPESRTKGERTRERILDIAYDSIVHKGFAATSIEELVEAAGITKSGFFYHFKDKNDLARQALERFIAEDNALIDGLTERARSLCDDPLQSFLLFLNLYAEAMDDMEELHPGCLIATVTYQAALFDPVVLKMNEASVLALRRRFSAWIEEIAERHPPRSQADYDALADMLTAIVEGSIVLSKALNDKSLMGRQTRLYRDHVKAVFGV